MSTGSEERANYGELKPAQVVEFVGTLVKAIRARQMYAPNNPAYQRLMAGFRETLGSLWRHTPALELTVEENGLRWEDRVFPAGEGRDTLPFLLYRDGIRQLVFLPGFEDEVERFVAVLLKARESGGDGDLVALLWEEEFVGFQYRYVDLLADGFELPPDTVPQPPLVSPDMIRAELGVAAVEPPEGPQSLERGEPGDGVGLADDVDLADGAEQAQGGAPTAEAGDLAAALIRDDLEAFHDLDPAERRRLDAEIEAEWNRDLRGAVLSALFDRLEDPIPARQTEILSILGQLLPLFLSQGEFGAAATIVRELQGAVASGVLGEAQRREAARLFEQLSEPTVLGQLLRLLEGGDLNPEAEDLAVYFAHLSPDALPLLMDAAVRTRSAGVRHRLEAAMDGLGRQQPEGVIELLGSADESMVIGAAAVVARTGLERAAPAVARLLGHGSAPVRRAAIDALVRLPSAATPEVADAFRRALQDADRDVRMAAARALAAARHDDAHRWFEAAFQEGALRDAELSEKIAFFESWGALAHPESVPVLDRLLNGKGLLGRRPGSDIRACAALALGRVGSPAAHDALVQAAADPDPVVRNAVSRALRNEAHGGGVEAR